METLERIYNENGYGEYEKQFLHHATVSLLNIYYYNSQVIFLSSFFRYKY